MITEKCDVQWSHVEYVRATSSDPSPPIFSRMKLRAKVLWAQVFVVFHMASYAVMFRRRKFRMLLADGSHENIPVASNVVESIVAINKVVECFRDGAIGIELYKSNDETGELGQRIFSLSNNEVHLGDRGIQ